MTYADLKHYFKDQDVADPCLQQVRDAVLRIRLGKGMVVTPDNPERRSAGSFFKNPGRPRCRSCRISPKPPLAFRKQMCRAIPPARKR